MDKTKVNGNDFLLMLETTFQEKLMRKTGWGRNEIKDLLRESMIETYKEYLELEVK